MDMVSVYVLGSPPEAASDGEVLEIKAFAKSLGAGLAARGCEVLLTTDCSPSIQEDVLLGVLDKLPGQKGQAKKPLVVELDGRHSEVRDLAKKHAGQVPLERSRFYVERTGNGSDDREFKGKVLHGFLDVARRAKTVIVVGGKDDTKSLAIAAHLMGVPVVSVTAFGGAARAVSEFVLQGDASSYLRVDTVRQDLARKDTAAADNVCDIAEEAFRNCAERSENEEVRVHQARAIAAWILCGCAFLIAAACFYLTFTAASREWQAQLMASLDDAHRSLSTKGGLDSTGLSDSLQELRHLVYNKSLGDLTVSYWFLFGVLFLSAVAGSLGSFVRQFLRANKRSTKPPSGLGDTRLVFWHVACTWDGMLLGVLAGSVYHILHISRELADPSVELTISKTWGILILSLVIPWVAAMYRDDFLKLLRETAGRAADGHLSESEEDRPLRPG